MPGLLGILEIDGVDLQQGEIALAVLGTADVPVDGIAGPEPEPADLGGRDVDIVGPRQVIGFRGAQEAEAVREHFDHALADDVDFAAGQLLEDGEHQLLLAHGAGVFDFELLGKAEQLGRSLGFEILQFHFPHAGYPVGVDRWQ